MRDSSGEPAAPAAKAVAAVANQIVWVFHPSGQPCVFAAIRDAVSDYGTEQASQPVSTLQRLSRSDAGGGLGKTGLESH